MHALEKYARVIIAMLGDASAQKQEFPDDWMEQMYVEMSMAMAAVFCSLPSY